MEQQSQMEPNKPLRAPSDKPYKSYGSCGMTRECQNCSGSADSDRCKDSKKFSLSSADYFDHNNNTNNNNNNYARRSQSGDSSTDVEAPASVGTGRYQGRGSSSSSATTRDEASGQSKPTQDVQQDLLRKFADRIPCLGIMLALGASFFLGTAGMLVKITTSVNGIQVAVLRAGIQLVVYSSIVSYRGLKWWPEKGEMMAVMGRALLGASSITVSYYALKLIPLGDAATIRFSLPIWTLIISYLLLGESCSLWKIFAVIVCISGVLLISKPDDCVHVFQYIGWSMGIISDSDYELYKNYLETIKSNSSEIVALSETMLDNNSTGAMYHFGKSSGEDPSVTKQMSPDDWQQLEGCLLALASSIFLATSLIALRLCQRTPAECTIVWLSIWSIVLGTVTLICLQEWRLPDNWLDVLYILLNGACGAIGQWFITSALKIEQSGIVSLARTADIEVAFLYSAFLLHEQIRATSIVGSIMVSLGVVAVVIPKWLESRTRSAAPRN